MGSGGVALACGLLCVLGGRALSFCALTDYTLYVEKAGCDFCVAINTTICMGFCYSRDTNIVGLAGKRLLLQRTCTYRSVEYHTTALPGCHQHADPFFSYPVALDCYCSTCDTGSHDCTHKGGDDNSAQCAKPLLHIYPYPGQSNHI
ncbi:thyrotropin beta-like [Arapaima gigas]|uniref:Thyrotropin subunit beta n=1 Tax=Arapaima gigas TaxID=113544 RepID=A0A977TF91_ARAGI|nr:beta thyroid stimulating hormone precursor [Arapaima gigas]